MIPKLHCTYFNPVVKDWTEECYKEELWQRENCKYCLYVITPKMTGVYSIAEVVDDSNKRHSKTIFCFLKEDGGETFESFQVKSLCKVGIMIENNGGKWLQSLDEVAEYLNEKCEDSKKPCNLYDDDISAITFGYPQ